LCETHVAVMEAMRNAHKVFQSKTLKEKDPLDDTGVDGRIIFKT